MNYIKNILGVSVFILLVLICLGSVYAEDSASDEIEDTPDVEIEIDDDLDESDDSFDDDLDDNSDDEEDDDSDVEDSDVDDDSNDDDFEYNYSDFDYLKFKLTCYLDRYGNCSELNWTESEEFLNEYQIYLACPLNYTLNESSDGYKTYLKIYDSVVSTFDDYNLTENETAYLKFMVIFYLNYYGNVSANYTWNESENFANYTPPYYLLGALFDTSKSQASALETSKFLKSFNSFNPLSYALTNSTDANITAMNNQTDTEVPYSWDMDILLLIVVLVIVILIVL